VYTDPHVLGHGLSENKNVLELTCDALAPLLYIRRPFGSLVRILKDIKLDLVASREGSTCGKIKAIFTQM
jgi:hypothetical protein